MRTAFRLHFVLNLSVVAAQATFFALQNTYHFLTPDMWTPTRFEKQPVQEFTDFLARPQIGEAPKAYAY